MIFVACYTLDTAYEAEAKKLRASLEHHGLRHDIQGYESRGSWMANVHYIPIFCREMLRKHPGESIVYLDADCIVQRFPVLLFDLDQAEGVDFAVYHLARPQPPTMKRDPKNRYRQIEVPHPPWRELLDGTMYFRNTRESRDLVDQWIAQDEREPNKFEQKVLEEMLPSADIKWSSLPAEYCFIFDNDIQKGEAKEEPVIVHYQASRRLRKNQPTIKTTEAFLLKQPRPFAVVGNAASFKKGDGKKIDKFPTVIRMNNFIVEGFEPLVGKSTTAWCVNGWKDVPYRELGVPVFTPFGKKDIYPLDPWLKTCPHLMIPSVPWGNKCREAKKEGAPPSTGCVLLFLLESLGIESTAFGFDSFVSGHYWSPAPILRTIHRQEEGETYGDFQQVRVVT